MFYKLIYLTIALITLDLKLMVKAREEKYSIELADSINDFNSNTDTFIATFNCTQTKLNRVFLNINTKEWSTTLDIGLSCIKTEMDALAYCQRVYPDLNVVNILKIENKYFKITSCSNGCTTSIEKTENIYKCLYGAYKSTQQLYIPNNCLFQHIYSQNECKTNKLWNLLAKDKCKSLNNDVSSSYYSMNSSLLLQWCDAFNGGLSTFNGIEFVCCPKIKNLNNLDSLEEDDDIDDQLENENEQSVFTSIDDINQNSNLDSTKTSAKNPKKSLSNNEDSYNSNNKEQHHPALSYASIFFLLGFLFTIISFLVFYCYITNKKNISNKSVFNQNLINANNLINNEDSHINSMQINGYENPTYKFFEQDSNRPIV